MGDIIKYVNIRNFKSIANLKLEDCRRINLFIGYPNVGKSNVLEALGLSNILFLDSGDSLKKIIRIENKNDFFYNLSENTFSIETNLEIIKFNSELQLKIFRKAYDEIICQFSKQLELEKSNFEPHGEFYDLSDFNNVLKYIFRSENEWQSIGDQFLLPPFGENIIDTLSYSDDVENVKAWIKKEFAKYKLELVIDKSSDSLKVQKRLSGNEVLQLPYSSISDTLQRVIFYKTAIASNKNSVLLFEEPEAHAFPPYIRNITQDIIEAKNNQFFIVTHSPFIVNHFLEYADLRKEVAIYLFDFKNGQTAVKRLTDEEMDEVYNYDMDLFFNIERFLRDE
jgi:AAA15 family ATPase/GTPase